MYSKKLAVSIVSLVACLAGSAIYGSTTNSVKITIKNHATSAVNANNSFASSASPGSAMSAYTVPERYAGVRAAYRGAESQNFTLQPRLNIWGYSGNHTLGETQLLMPIYGDASKVFYGLLEGNIVAGNSSWLVGGGLGYRQVVNDARIFGGYALLDYNNSSHNHGFWVINPGLEMLGQVWDASINAYFPVNATRRTGATKWADDLFDEPGLNARDYIRFTGHDEYAHKFQIAEEAGHGVGVEVGRVIPYFTKAKIYLGGYYFDTEDFGSTNGVEARLTYDLNKYVGLEIKNVYDKVFHNQTLLGLRLTLGGYSDEQKHNFGISSRLTDPLEHNFARINGSSEVYIKRQYADRGEYHEYDNLWFFEPAATTSTKTKSAKSADAEPAVGSGTYENPFVGLTPSNYEAMNSSSHSGVVNPYPVMYFAPGTYGLQDFQSKQGLDGRFDLPNGWSMYGRTADYKENAQGRDRALFKGGVDLNYDSPEAGQLPNKLVSIRIHNTQNYADAGVAKTNGGSGPNAALYAYNASNVIFQDVDVQSNVTSSGYVSAYGIYSDSSTLNFNGGTNTVSSAVSDTNTVLDGSFAYGIYAQNDSAINFNSGTNAVSSMLTGSIIHGYAEGIDLGHSSVVFNGGTNIILAKDISDGHTEGDGIYAYHGSNITFNGGTNTVSGVGANTDVTSTGSWNAGIYIADPTATLIFNGGTNTISGEASGLSSGIIEGYGIYVDNHAYMAFNGGTNIVSGSGANSYNGGGEGNGYGIYAASGSTVDFNGGINTISGEGVDTGTGNSTYSWGIGINADNAEINFIGGTNSVIGKGTNVYYDGDGYGIYAYNGSTVNFNGGANTVLGTATDAYDGYALGIEIDNSTLNFNGGTNIISGDSTSSGSADVFYAEGIYGLNSTINFTGGTNMISAKVTATNNGDSYAYGIEANGATINFNGGTNMISAKVTATNNGDSYAYGIDAYNGSTINFTNPTDQRVNIIANGATDQYGIYADSSSQILNGATTMLPANIGNYVAFNTDDPSVDYAVYWQNQGTDWQIPW